MLYCVHCGAALSPGARACRRCGSIPALADPADESTACRVCAAHQTSSWRHCAVCGTATGRAGRPRMTKTTIAAEAGRFVRARQADPDSPPPGYETDENPWPADLHPGS